MKITESTFTIAANGFADGPAQALRDFLIKNHAKKVTTIAHPLVPEGKGEHIVTYFCEGKTTQKSYKLPHKPPVTYLFDNFTPLSLPDSDVWFGFNNLACMRGLVRRKTGKAKKVYYWAVDFSPKRFGDSTATKIYDSVDRYVCRNVNKRIELSQAALDGRTKYIGVPEGQLAPSMVVPMGAWLDRTPKAPVSAWDEQRVVYLGHLVERQGVAVFINALPLIKRKLPDVSVDIIGGGPLDQELRHLSKSLGLEKNVTFHGFVEDHKDVETILAKASVAVAPYIKDPKSFSQFADPGKLKAYLGASLPIVLTDVPPNANELAQAGAAILVDDNPQAVATGILGLLSSEQSWKKTHRAASKIAIKYDWNTILAKALGELGLE